MKRLFLSLTIVAAALLLPACGVFQPGTTATSTTYVQSGDTLVINAEKTTAIANDTFDAFLHLEKTNQAYVKEKFPAVHQFAEYLRQPQHARQWLKTARSLTKAYKVNRDPDSASRLRAILSTLGESVNQAKLYTTQITNSTP